MKILLLPAYFYPEQTANLYLVENYNQAFAEQGWDIEVYTPTPCRGIDKSIHEKYKNKKFRIEKDLDGHRTIHRFSLHAERKNPILRAWRYTLGCIKYFNRGVFGKDARLCDIMFISSTPPIQGAMGVLIKKFRNIPLVYNLQDVFPDSLVGTGLAPKDGILWKIGRVIENFTYRNSDKIIVISEDFKRNIMDKGVPESKIEVVYNWVDEEAVVPILRDKNPIFDELNLDRNKFYIVYAGNLGNAQNVEIIIDVANQLQNYNEIQFVIFGTGGMEHEYKEKVKLLQLNNISFFPLQPYEKVSQVYSIGDACIVSCKKGLGGSAMPSKTWSIMSAGRAVIANFDEGELKTILENNNCGIFTKADDKQAFKNAILKLYNDRKMTDELGKNGREFILNNLTRKIGTDKYVQVMKEVYKKSKNETI